MTDPGEQHFWLQLSVALPPRGLEPLLLDALRRSGAREVVRASNRSDGTAGDRVRAVFRVPRAPREGGAFDARVEARLRAALPSVARSDLDPRWQPFDGAAWLARRGEGRVPLRGGRELRILAGVAFGDGGHPTTRRCVEVIESVVRPGERWLDIGAGSGILSMAAAACGAREVVAIEMDPAGCDEIRENCRRNEIDTVSVVRLEVTSGRRGPVRDGAPWDGIVANLEAGVLVPLLPALGPGGPGGGYGYGSGGGAVSPGGWVVTSGILAPERGRVEGAAAAGGLGLDGALEDDGWWTLVFRAPPR